MSASEISTQSPLPVFVTNPVSDNQHSLLPDDFKVGSKWMVQNVIGSSSNFRAVIHSISGCWAYCDVAVAGGSSAEKVWLYVPGMSGFTWKLDS